MSGINALRHAARWPRRAGLAVIALGALCSLAIALATPPWESNDEPDHVRNIEVLASGHWYRIADGAGYSPHQPPLYYLALAGWQRVVGLVVDLPAELPKPQQGDATTANGQFGHAQPQDRHDRRRLLWLRLPSIVLGALTVWLTGRVARELLGLAGRDRRARTGVGPGGPAPVAVGTGLGEWTAVAAMATVAFIPKFVFSSSFVNNDVLATTLGATATLFAVRMWRSDEDAWGRPWGGAPGGSEGATPAAGVSRPSRSDAALAWGLGLTCGALLATKLSTIPFVAVIAVAVLWRWRRSPSRLALCAFPAAALALPVFVTNQLRYGDPLAAKASIDYFRSWIPALVAAPHTFGWLGRAVTSGAATSFWYTSGWNQFRWKAQTYLPLWGLAIAGLLGHPIRRGRASKGTGLAFALVLAALSSIWVLAWNTTQWQARIAFPGLAAFGALVATGWRRWGVSAAVQFALPLCGLAGTLYAIKTDVFGRY